MAKTLVSRNRGKAETHRQTSAFEGMSGGNDMKKKLQHTKDTEDVRDAEKADLEGRVDVGANVNNGAGLGRAGRVSDGSGSQGGKGSDGETHVVSRRSKRT